MMTHRLVAQIGPHALPFDAKVLQNVAVVWHNQVAVLKLIHLSGEGTPVNSHWT